MVDAEEEPAWTVPAGMVEADEFSGLVSSRLSDSVVVVLLLMTRLGLVVSEESRARKILAASATWSSTLPLTGGRERELEEPV